MKRRLLVTLGFAAVAAVLIHHYQQDVSKIAEKEPPMTGWHRSVVRDGPAVAARWQKAIKRTLAAHRSRLPADLIVGIMLTESMGKSRARNPSGATGLLMVKPIVCRELKKVRCDLLNPRENIALGIQYLGRLQVKYGFEGERLILAYGVGPVRAREILKTKTPLAHKYVRRVLFARNLGNGTGSDI